MELPRPRPPVDKQRFYSLVDYHINAYPRSTKIELICAIRDGDHREFGRILSRLTHQDRAGLHKWSMQGFGLLHIAAHFDDVEICRILIAELNFDVNRRCQAGLTTPLGCASLFGEKAVVQYLLKCGADPNKKDNDGCAALHNAAQNGNPEVVRLLLAGGAIVDTTVAQGTPVHIAASYGNQAALKILLDNHSDPNWSSEDVYNPLVTAIGSSRHGLHEYALECVKLLVSAGANVNSTHPDSPLVVAVVFGFTSCVEYLLTAGANANVPDKQGCLPIQIAARVGSRRLVELLLPNTSPITSVAHWSIEGIISHEKLSRSAPKISKRSASNSLVTESPRVRRNMQGPSCGDMQPEVLTPQHKKHRTSVTSTFTTPRRSSASVSNKRESYSAQSKFEKRKSVTTRARGCKRILQYGFSSESSDSSSPASDRLGIMTLAAYAKKYRTRLAEKVRVPHQNATRRLTQRGPKLVVRRTYEVIAGRHSREKAMDGCFTADNFNVDMVDNTVTIHDVLEVTYTHTAGRKDWQHYVVMIRDDIFAGEVIPEDLHYWLELISKEEDPWSPSLLSNHIYMVDSRQAYGLFMSFVSSIHSLRTDKPTKYEDLFHHEIFSKYMNWNHTFRFEPLNETAKYRNPETGAEYDRDIMGMIWLFRCCWQHRAQKFPHLLVAVTLGEKVPDLLSDVQKALDDFGICN